MKIKYLVIIFTLLTVFAIAVTTYQFKSKDTGELDIVAINDAYNNILDELTNGTDAAIIEEEYNCNIIFKSMDNYQSQVLEELENGKVLMDYEYGGQLVGKIAFAGEREYIEGLIDKQEKKTAALLIVFLSVGYLLLYIIYHYYTKPFDKYQGFAREIAKGNLDMPLPMVKNNYFGAFTESFDLMREELVAAREKEHMANISKKELVAELSHDIKTPVATIKATCEVINAELSGIENSIKDGFSRKVTIIERKADTIDELVSNMFHATLEELEYLKVEVDEQPSLIISEIINGLNNNDNLHVVNEIPKCLLYMDRLRLEQVIDNIVSNSEKYAGTDIDICYENQIDGVLITISDRGSGVPEDEIAMLTSKFYRGSNSKGKSGSGLGLYLAYYFMTNMKGDMECYNDNGFVVRLYIAKVK